jgi:N-acylneuraminate cytidylyltransferase
MTGSLRILGIIPARGGSKGVPRKNIREVGGKPLIVWTIEEARKSRHIHRLVVSSDDDEILAVAAQYGCETLKRPAELARDDTPACDVIAHALQYDPSCTHVVLLQPTSPLRTLEDIDGCIEACLERNAPACVSVCEVEISPYWMYTIDGTGRLAPLLGRDAAEYTRRQLAPKVYALNGAVYVARADWYLLHKTFVTDETIPYIMPQERSMDIDTPFQLELADCWLRRSAGFFQSVKDRKRRKPPE